MFIRLEMTQDLKKFKEKKGKEKKNTHTLERRHPREFTVSGKVCLKHFTH